MLRLGVAVLSTILGLALVELLLHYRFGPEPPVASSREPRSVAGAADARPLVKILSLGDSIGHGYGLANTDDAYPHLLQRALNARDPSHRYEVAINGVHTPSTDAPSIRQWLADVRPAWVIREIELSNDVTDEALAQWDGADADGLPVAIRGGRYVNAWDGGPLATVARGHWYDRTRVHAFALRAWGRVLRRLRPNPVFDPAADTYYYNLGFDQPYLTTAAVDAGFEQLFRALAATDRLVTRLGGKYLVVILPSQYAFENGQYRAGADRLLARAEQSAKALGLNVILPRQVLAAAGGARLFQDFCHPTEAGHAAIARAIDEAMAGRWTD